MNCAVLDCAMTRELQGMCESALFGSSLYHASASPTLSLSLSLFILLAASWQCNPDEQISVILLIWAQIFTRLFSWLFGSRNDHICCCNISFSFRIEKSAICNMDRFDIFTENKHIWPGHYLLYSRLFHHPLVYTRDGTAEKTCVKYC